MPNKPKGLPKTGGRQKGTPNKIVHEVKLVAREYTEEALATLARIMRSGLNEQARVSAADKLLDRGWGKPNQSMTGADDKPLFPHITLDFSGNVTTEDGG